MRKFVLIMCLLAVSIAFAQQGSKPAKTAAPAKAKATAPASKAAAETKPAAASNEKLPSQEVIAAFLKQMFGYDQNLVFRVAEVKESSSPGVADATVVVSTPQGQQVMHLYIPPDQQNAIVGEMMPFGADPFKKTRAELESAFGPTQGPKDAPVTIVEFGDLQCPSCKAVQPTVDKLLKDEPNVRLIFQNFPLETIHPWAGKAARYLDCIERKDNQAALTFLTAVYTHQGEIVENNVQEKLSSYAKMAGQDPAAIEACSKTPETDARIKRGIELGKQVEVTGTPTLFVNGRKLSNVGAMPYEVLKSIVDFAAQKQ